MDLIHDSAIIRLRRVTALAREYADGERARCPGRPNGQLSTDRTLRSATIGGLRLGSEFRSGVAATVRRGEIRGYVSGRMVQATSGGARGSKVLRGDGATTLEILANIPRYGRGEDIALYRKNDLVEPSILCAVVRDIRNHVAGSAPGITRDEPLAQQAIDVPFIKRSTTE